MNVDGRWYSPVMKVSAMTHGTVDQGGSICDPEKKLEGFTKAQTPMYKPRLDGPSAYGWNGSLLLRRSAGEVFETSQRLLASEIRSAV